MGRSTLGRRLAAYIQTLHDFPHSKRGHKSYGHMGATLCDAGLQAGLNYRTVVAPRIRNLVLTWPFATTTTAFVQASYDFGLQTVLSWRHHEKLARISDWSQFFLTEMVETEVDLREWLRKPTNCERLRNRRGVGPKTLDYLKMLTGLQAIAVDRHIKSFVADAGITLTQYEDIQRVTELAAESLGISSSELDYQIWWHMSTKVS